MMKKMLVRLGVTAFLGSVWVTQAYADELVKLPFADTPMTTEQRKAWAYYLADESGQYGCQYGDDERLKDDPRGTLSALASGEDMEPVKVTLRTFLSASDNVQTLLQRNMFIASMECNTVYYFDGELIGHPVLPFEEYLDILLDKLEQESSIQAHIEFLRGTKIAAIDARWFWPFYIMDSEHFRMHGHDYEIISALVDAIPGDAGDITAYSSYWQIYEKLISQGIYVADTNSCDGESSEPNEDVIIDKNLPWDPVAALYNVEGVEYKGKWKPKVKREEDGFTLAESSVIEEPVNPYFNVNRRVTIYPKECR